MHLAPSDEFFIWPFRKPNFQSDRIWSKRIEDIEEDERYRELVKNLVCVGIFLIFTAKKLHWVIKERGQSWDGEYFRETILKQNVIPFLKNQANVVDTDQVTFIHDKAPCMKANATQELLTEAGIDFWGNNVWPGNSPDLNSAEHVGAILMDEVEGKMLKEPISNRFSYDVLLRHVKDVLTSLENRTELFQNLLYSYPDRIKAVLAANGKHTNY